MARTGYPSLPEAMQLTKDSLGRLARACNQLLAGKQNNVATLTLTANAATTTFQHPLLGPNSYVDFDPMTANAATEKAAGTLYCLTANRGAGTWTLTNANNAQADRTFQILIVG